MLFDKSFCVWFSFLEAIISSSGWKVGLKVTFECLISSRDAFIKRVFGVKFSLSGVKISSHSSFKLTKRDFGIDLFSTLLVASTAFPVLFPDWIWKTEAGLPLLDQILCKFDFSLTYKRAVQILIFRHHCRSKERLWGWVTFIIYNLRENFTNRQRWVDWFC